jgi:tetratricopeptide (TPR) repeat protein
VIEVLLATLSSLIKAGADRLLSWRRKRGLGEVIPVPHAEELACVGRAAEFSAIDDFARSVEGSRIFNIHGGPAIGKTALAQHAAKRLSNRYTHVHILLHGDAGEEDRLSTGQALTELLTRQGVLDSELTDDKALSKRWQELTKDLLREVPNTRGMLLVLDDWHADVDLKALMPCGRDALVLVTSREPVPDVGRYRVERLLLEELPDKAIPEVYRSALGEVPRRLDLRRLIRAEVRVPLALKLIAGAARASPPLTVRDMTRALNGDPSVQNAFAHIYERLPDRLAMHLRRLSLYPGTGMLILAPEAAAAICGTTDATECLDELCLRNLIDRVTKQSQQRLRMHEQIRSLAQERSVMEPFDARRAARERGWKYYETTARAKVTSDGGTKWGRTRHDRANDPAGGKGTRGVVSLDESDGVDAGLAEAVTWYARERSNLLAYLRFAHQHEWDSCTVRLTDALAGLFRNGGPWQEAERLHGWAAEAALRLAEAAAEDSDKAAWRLDGAVALNDRGIIRRLLGRLDGAIKSLDDAYELSDHLDSDLGRANARHEQGIVMNEKARAELSREKPDLVPLRNHLELAEKYLMEAYGLYLSRQQCNGIGWANGAKNLGVTHYLLWRAGVPESFNRSGEFFGKARSGYERINDLLGLAEVGNWRGRLQLDDGTVHEVDEAQKEFEDALALAKVTHCPLEEARAHKGLGDCYWRKSRAESKPNARRRARDHYLEALQKFRSVGSAAGEKEVRNKLEDLED